MNRRPLSYSWTEEDRLTRAKWRRGMAVFYGCLALVVFGLIALRNSSSVAPSAASESAKAGGLVSHGESF